MSRNKTLKQSAPGFYPGADCLRNGIITVSIRRSTRLNMIMAATHCFKYAAIAIVAVVTVIAFST